MSAPTATSAIPVKLNASVQLIDYIVELYGEREKIQNLYKNLNSHKECSERTLELHMDTVDLGDELMDIVALMYDLAIRSYSKHDQNLMYEQLQKYTSLKPAFHLKLDEMMESLKNDVQSSLPSVVLDMENLRISTAED